MTIFGRITYTPLGPQAMKMPKLATTRWAIKAFPQYLCRRCVCMCVSDTLIDVITCALNIYCIGRRHGTFFFTSPCVCVCVWLLGLSVYCLLLRQWKQKVCQRRQQKAIAGRCLRQRAGTTLVVAGMENSWSKERVKEIENKHNLKWA